MTSPKRDCYALIRDMIMKRDVLPNERLIEVDLATRIGTNRTNIRKALARLEQDGLVVSEANRGARVRLVTEAEALEIFEVRGVLDVLVAGQAAARAKKKDCDRLRVFLGGMRAAVEAEDHVQFTIESRKLHEEMWRISNHQTATRSLASLGTQLVRFRFRSITVPGRIAASIVEHEAIVEAICAGDQEGARRAMRINSDSAITALKRAIKIEAQR